ncbi:hypothetical protein RHSIM_RhsimUnG0085100 [Rhododendron simsii]|uniref:Uncharacterized protein n=1 Tax=Rhododendron simsii TaxID=118357 RepID=A0A834L2P7_RHOSS|nr:hypothetical protein RHSIM_RhsimUnG0085100 [Rhododendron simsii]
MLRGWRCCFGGSTIVRRSDDEWIVYLGYTFGERGNATTMEEEKHHRGLFHHHEEEDKSSPDYLVVGNTPPNYEDNSPPNFLVVDNTHPDF